MTNQILTPGYVRWDGTKYVLDPISPSDRTGPPGPAGPPGSAGPEGPAGPAGAGTDASPLSTALFVDSQFPIDTVSGNSLSIDSVSNGQTFVTGISLASQNFLGKKLTVSGAASSANNGEFVILSVTPSISYYNPAAVAPDANNNSISFSVSCGTGLVEGNAANITAAGSGLATLTGLSGMNSEYVGKRIIITNATSSGNNGAFLVVTLNSSTSVDIFNPNASAPDANNGSIGWTFRDGSVSKPFATLQQAVNAVFYRNTAAVALINLVLAPGVYDGFTLTAGGGANIVMSALGTSYGGVEGTNFTPENGGALIGSDIVIDGGEGQIFLSLKDIFTNEFSYTPTQVRLNGALRELFLDKSFVRLDSSGGGADLVTMYDDDSFLHNTSNAVPVRYKSYLCKLMTQTGAVSGSIHQPHLYAVTGSYNITIVLEITAAATTGTISVDLAWTDDVGATSETLITNFDATTTGRVAAYLPVHLNASDINYTTTLTGVTGTLNYNLIISVTATAKESA